MPRNEQRKMSAIFDEGSAIDEAMRRGWERAVRRHRGLGIPLLVSERGQVVELNAFDVEIPDRAPGVIPADLEAWSQ